MRHAHVLLCAAALCLTGFVEAADEMPDVAVVSAISGGTCKAGPQAHHERSHALAVGSRLKAGDDVLCMPTAASLDANYLASQGHFTIAGGGWKGFSTQGTDDSGGLNIYSQQKSPGSHGELHTARTERRELSRSVKSALAKDQGIDASAIQVRARKGVVTLTGTVPDAGQVAKAGEIAKGVEGVASVSNKVNVQMAEDFPMAAPAGASAAASGKHRQ